MALTQKTGALLLVVIVAVYVQLFSAHEVGQRCLCKETFKYLAGNISDFQFYEPRPGCNEPELILTFSISENSTVAKCMNTKGKLAKAFRMCWERINRDEARKMECIQRQKRSQ